MEINMGREYIDGKVVGIEDFARDCDLEILWSEKGYKLPLSTVSVNRPGLVLSGFDDYFAGKRLQVMGNAEMYFLYKMDWITNNGTALSDKFIEYALPLIQGDAKAPLEDGLPRFAKLKKVLVEKL